VDHVFELLDRIQLLILEPNILVEVSVESAHLLKQLENDLVDIVVLLDNVQGLVTHLLLEISSEASMLENVDGDSAHLDRFELG
jgi:hypothetical protein